MASQDGLKNNPFLKHFILFISLLSASPVFANTYKDCGGDFSCLPTRPHGLLVLSGGYGYASVGKSQLIKAAGNVYDYDADTSGEGRPYGGVTLGGEFHLQDGFDFDAGLSFYETTAYRAEGVVSIPSEDFVHNYRYSLIGRQVLLEFKMLKEICSRYHPYIALGAGEAFNSSYEYETKPKITLKYKNALTHSFAYLAGFGVDVNLVDYIRLGAGYRYANLGNADLGHGHIKGEGIKSDAIETTNFNTQSWILQLTFLI